MMVGVSSNHGSVELGAGRRNALAVVNIQRGEVLSCRRLPREKSIHGVAADDRRDRVLVTSLPKNGPARPYNYRLAIIALPAKADELSLRRANCWRARPASCFRAKRSRSSPAASRA